MNLKAIALCGSLRPDSYNLKLLHEICFAVEQHAITIQKFYGDSMNLPFVISEKDSLSDPKVSVFHQALKESQLIIIASPEYNGGISGVLKNAIDWGSFAGNAWAGKLALLASASTGPLAGTRGLIQLRTILSGIKCWMLPEQVQCGLADKAFDQAGHLIDEKTKKQLATAVASLIEHSKKFF